MKTWLGVSPLSVNLISMTGYGESTKVMDGREWRCVIQSVNSRNLDLRFRLPSGLQALEIQFRKCVQSCIHRGKVDVAITFTSLSSDEKAAAFSNSSFNSDWVLSFCRAGELLFDPLSWPASDDLRAALLRSAFSQRHAFADEALDVDVVSDDLTALLLCTLRLHGDSCRGEGTHLAVDIKDRLALLQSNIAVIQDSATLMPELFRERIASRISALIDDVQYEVDPVRMTQEIAHLIDKADISEEIVRFCAHIDQFYTEIDDSVPERKGKKLEFVVQEMLREINTVGSKANLLEITRRVVDVKNELEKIREQVQNVV